MGLELPVSDEDEEEEEDEFAELGVLLEEPDPPEEFEEPDELDSSEDFPSEDLDSCAPNLLCPDGERWSVA